MAIEPIKTYEIPGIGRVELIHDSEGDLHGHYFLKSDYYGHAGRRSVTPEEALKKGGIEIRKYLEEKKSSLEKEIEPLNRSLLKMSLNKTKPNQLEDFEIHE